VRDTERMFDGCPILPENMNSALNEMT
jgi:hypothetical protein